MMRTVAHVIPFAALGGGILILLKPQLLNYVVAIYLILVGAIGINHVTTHPAWAGRGPAAWAAGSARASRMAVRALRPLRRPVSTIEQRAA